MSLGKVVSATRAASGRTEISKETTRDLAGYRGLEEAQAMASVDLRVVFKCSICQDIYNDPVNLPCGHNFCRNCIDRVLDIQEVERRDYVCPYCRRASWIRPFLQTNVTVRYMVNDFLAALKDQKEIAFPCSYCIYFQAPAVKACIHCGAHLCEKHLNVHSTSPEHVLCNPTNYLEEKKCPTHRKILEYYCPEDSACICVSCRLDGEHRGHQVETLQEASGKKLNKLRNMLPILNKHLERTMEEVQNLKERRRKVEEKAIGETKRVTGLLRDLTREVQGLEEKVLSAISSHAECLSLSYTTVIRQLGMKISELSSQISYVEELCSMADPLTVLQESDTDYFCDTENGENEDRVRETFDKQLYHDGALNLAGISLELYATLSNIMYEEILQERANSQAYLRYCIEGTFHCTTESPRTLPQPIPTTESPQNQIWSTNSHTVQVILWLADCAGKILEIMASNDLLKTEGRNHVFSSDRPKTGPETREGSNVPQVILAQSSASGRHDCPLDLGESQPWRVGMYCSSINPKKLDLFSSGYRKKWWLLQRWSDVFSMIDEKVLIQLRDIIVRFFDMIFNNRIGISVDYDTREIFLYSCEDPTSPPSSSLPH
ncbi:E3 ubiquitin-protein ligase TRIM11-like [Hyperolius riggenbachi]|uniref:E3 ubiquitin-protein ligase TRIM11-like n=1 Tax=Hyperolius riggenbachi TaxID=752182 RepID=UPI0035A3BD04